MLLLNCLRASASVRSGLLGAVLLAVFAGIAPTTTLAVSPHCRDLEFNGAAGAASHDKVKFRVKDSLGTLLDESCLIQVQPSESAISFASRIPGAWGTSAGAVCPSMLPSPLPNKTCGTANTGYSCKHTWVFKKGKLPTDPPKKRYLRICCFESPNCKGPSLGAPTKKLCTAGNVGAACKHNTDCDTSPGNGRCSRRPITIQTKVESLAYTPADSEIPFAGGITPVAIDPIGMTQKAPKALQSCRTGLRDAMQNLAQAYWEGVADCWLHVMKGEPAYDSVDCNNPDLSDPVLAPFKQIVSAQAKLQDVAATQCLPSGSPLAQGFTQCPSSACSGSPMDTCTAPASHLGASCTSHDDCNTNDGVCSGATCTAGMIGQFCTVNQDCNTKDGQCGAPDDWSLAADCLFCSAAAEVTAPGPDIYGSPPIQDPQNPDPSLDPFIKCQDTIGHIATSLLNGQLNATFNCQSGVDSGATSLPAQGLCTSGSVQSCVSDVECDTAIDTGDGYCAPAPVSGYALGGVCTSGKIDSCSVDPDCDTLPGLGDGRCGPDLACVAGKGHCTIDQNCDTNHDGHCSIGGTCDVGIIGKPCTIDRDCDSSPADGQCSNGYCKFSDAKGLRANAETNALDRLNRACFIDTDADLIPDTDLIAGLTSCGTDIDSEFDCLRFDVRDVSARVADMAVPEGIASPAP